MSFLDTLSKPEVTGPDGTKVYKNRAEAALALAHAATIAPTHLDPTNTVPDAQYQGMTDLPAANQPAPVVPAPFISQAITPIAHVAALPPTSDGTNTAAPVQSGGEVTGTDQTIKNTAYDALHPLAANNTTKGNILSGLLLGGLGALAGGGTRTAAEGFSRGVVLPHQLAMQGATEQAADLHNQAAAQDIANEPREQARKDATAEGLEAARKATEAWRQGQLEALPQATQLALAKNGLRVARDAEGKPTGALEDDPDSQAFKLKGAHADLMSAQQENVKAQKELRDAEAEVSRQKINPNSPLYHQAQERLATAHLNANASMMKAQSQLGRYYQQAYNKGLDGNTLPGAPEVDGTVVGTGNAQTLQKQLPRTQQMTELYGGIDRIDGALKRLSDEGGSLNDAPVAAALADPTHSSTMWLQGKVKANLTPTQRDAVIASKAFDERLAAMRAASGNIATQQQMDLIKSLAPNASTPDYDTARRQLESIRSQVDVLQEGVPGMHGIKGVDKHPDAAHGGAGGGTLKETRNYQGHTYAKGSDGQWHLQ